MVENSFGEKEIICMTINLQIAQTAGNFNHVLYSVTAEDCYFFLKCPESTNSHINYQSQQIQNTCYCLLEAECKVGTELVF